MIDHAKLWSEGKYIDLWTIPHILAGVVLAGFLDWLGFPFWSNFLISSFFIIGWEFFERRFLNIHEHLTNKIMDVLTGWLGFLVTYSLITRFSLEKLAPYLISLTVVYLLLNLWGFLAYKRRKLQE